MGARKPVKENSLHKPRDLRRPLRNHPPLDLCLSRPDRAAIEVNTAQPLATPEVLDSGQFGFDVAVPIELDEKDGRYRPPSICRPLQDAFSLHKMKLYISVVRAANSPSLAEDWISRNAPLMGDRCPPRLTAGALAMIGLNQVGFEDKCKGDLDQSVGKLRRNGSNLDRKDVEKYLTELSRLFYLLNDHIVYFKYIYRKFADIANKNFRGGNESGKEVTLGRLQEAVMCLPKVVSMDDLLDASFYGLTDSSMIHLSHWVMSDLLDLTGALGHLRYGSFHPTIEQARTCLYVVGCAPDASPYRDRLAAHRRRLADRLLSRYGLLNVQSELTEVCCAVACRRRLPEFPLRLQIGSLA